MPRVPALCFANRSTLITSCVISSCDLPCKQGIAELEALPEIDGSIIYTMEIQTLVNNLRALYLLVDDERLDNETVAGEIKKTMAKIQPSGESQAEQKTEEELAIENAKNIAFNACIRALDSLKLDK